MKLRLFTLVFILMLVATPVAFAGNPHFIYATASINDSGALVVNFKEAGLGDNQLIKYELTADATAVYYCVNGGGKHPQAANKETVSGPVSGTGAFSSGKNGSIVASVSADPPGPGSFACPPGQRLLLGEVYYTNVAFWDITTPEQATDISGAFDRVFWTF